MSTSNSPIPEPRLSWLRNWTPFAELQCDKMAPGRNFHDIVVVKGTFVIEEGRLALARSQAPVTLADEPWDPADAERSSLKRAGEAILVKPRTDVLVTGTARAAGERPRTGWEVGVAVERRGEAVLEHDLLVTGPRRFRHDAERGWVITEAEPTTSVPIRYELAYGGAYRDPPTSDGAWVLHEPNPSGTGFFDARALDTRAEYPAPQWSVPAHPVTGINTDVPLAGLGPIARRWSARLPFAGTYDDAWERAMREDAARGLPADYAADFDPRFFQCAHPALIAPGHLAGDERIVLRGLHPDPDPLALQLPGARVVARMLDGRGQRIEERLPLDTVHVDLDQGRVYLCWRLTLDQARDVRAAAIYSTEGA